MGSKLYYDCPIAAAYMNKEFDVRFLNSYLLYKTITELACHDYINTKYYIHPDSLDIFEPREDDVVLIHWDSGNKVVKVHTQTAADHLAKTKTDWQIIQRNGKAFIMPKKEVNDDNI